MMTTWCYPLLFAWALPKPPNFKSVYFLCCLLLNSLVEDVSPPAFSQLQSLEDTLCDIFHSHNNYFPWYLINTNQHKPKHYYSYSWHFCIEFSWRSQVIYIVPTMPLEAMKASHQFFLNWKSKVTEVTEVSGAPCWLLTFTWCTAVKVWLTYGHTKEHFHSVMWCGLGAMFLVISRYFPV